MAQPRRWVDEIIEALEELGGESSLADIAQRIEDRNLMDFSQNKHWRDRIRSTIYHYSSDCDIYTGEVGSEKDIFYAVRGKGNGYWGLRIFEPKENTVALTDDDLGFREGRKKLVQHVIRERNPRVIQLAKEKFKKEHNGKLFCEVCGFDFLQTYGEIGQDFIEGHHTMPVSEVEGEYSIKVEDIAMVCSNCHRMLHRKRPWLTKEQLKGLIKNIGSEKFNENK
ncbi:HNH endonuclease [Priestia aryabhattai]|uniref:HNH endonuclease n=1 Tax=Priestia aryabhattai TaxID=412384 RepID=UPI0035AC0D4B